VHGYAVTNDRHVRDEHFEQSVKGKHGDQQNSARIASPSIWRRQGSAKNKNTRNRQELERRAKR